MPRPRFVDRRTALRRLERAMSILSETDGDWFWEGRLLDDLRETECDADLRAIHTLITVAKRGEHLHWFYVGPEHDGHESDDKEPDRQ